MSIEASEEVKLVKADCQEELVAFVCRNFPAFPVCEGKKAFKAAFAVICPLPPFAMGTAEASEITGSVPPVLNKGEDADTLLTDPPPPPPLPVSGVSDKKVEAMLHALDVRNCRN